MMHVINEISEMFTINTADVDGLFVVDNGLLRAKINSWGQIVSLIVVGDERDLFRKSDGTQLGGNQLLMYDDEPLYWDAWDVMDYHLETAKVVNAEGVSKRLFIDLLF